MNRVVLVGRLARDPELRYTQSGIPVANFTIAVNRPFTNQQGEREADFIDVVVWRAQAENCANYLTKGSLAGVDGRLQVRSYETPEGQKRRVTEVIADRVEFLGRPREGAAGPSPGPGFTPAESPDENEAAMPPEDNEVPF
ncbi:MAG: single-stranded DNA-binding protein [Firmicutes bacterium]|nr:single-stranded DNA-binding protein [Bacillota bacterium]